MNHFFENPLFENPVIDWEDHHPDMATKDLRKEDKNFFFLQEVRGGFRRPKELIWTFDNKSQTPIQNLYVKINSPKPLHSQVGDMSRKGRAPAWLLIVDEKTRPLDGYFNEDYDAIVPVDSTPKTVILKAQFETGVRLLEQVKFNDDPCLFIGVRPPEEFSFIKGQRTRLKPKTDGIFTFGYRYFSKTSTFYNYINGESVDAFLGTKNFTFNDLHLIQLNRGYQIVRKNRNFCSSDTKITWRVANDGRLKCKKVSITVNTPPETKWHLVTDEFQAELNHQQENIVDLNFCPDNIDLVLSFPHNLESGDFMNFTDALAFEIKVWCDDDEATYETYNDSLLIVHCLRRSHSGKIRFYTV